MTRVLKTDAEAIAQAGALLAQGALVAFPTETVYGLGADARNGAAVAAIYEAKGRPSFNPLIVHVPDIKMARSLTVWTETADKLAQAFWPGALTLVLPLKTPSTLSSLVTAGLPSVAIRVPAHPVARQLLQAARCPVAAPSANPSGKISPTRAAHVLAGMDGKIEAVLDGGACDVGLESTIVGVTDAPALLRAGGVAAEAIEAVLGFPLAQAEAGKITAPGQLTSHYAPRARVRLDAAEWQPGELRLGFGDVACDLNLSETSDLAEAASRLFDHLHALDAMEGARIAVSPIPHHGLGAAINDRLRRAAAERP
ncbi:MAG: L-threonylcarbamoyladenylate synthase [Pseudomonadota bacterium]